MAKNRVSKFEWEPTRIPKKARQDLLAAKDIVDTSKHLPAKFKGDLMNEAMSLLLSKYKRLEKQGEK